MTQKSSILKINKVKLYRISRLIQDDIYNYIKTINNFKFLFIKLKISSILNKYNLEYNLEYNIDYIYDKLENKVIIKIENNILIEINFKYDEEFSI